jgi:sterol desaturase/sphingolipid hydroxylase (fatty acid hydroxylase superfamily)
VTRWLRALPAVALALEGAALVRFERRSPLRAQGDPAALRDARNLLLGALGLAPVLLVEMPCATWLARELRARRLAPLQRLGLPAALETLVALALLDYTTYWWNVVAHRVPSVWRYHLVHHVDRDCSATTALRFHPGELALGAVWRALQAALLGPSPADLERYRWLLLAATLFHHANLRLPLELERALGRFVVTPRAHGAHHATDQRIACGNYSSGLTVWDRLHGTWRGQVAPERIIVGLPAYRRDEDVGLRALLALPLRPERDPYRTR